MDSIAIPFDAARPLGLYGPNDYPSTGGNVNSECVNMRKQIVSMPALIQVRGEPMKIEMRDYLNDSKRNRQALLL